jgi:hypothetical protein
VGEAGVEVREGHAGDLPRAAVDVDRVDREAALEESREGADHRQDLQGARLQVGRARLAGGRVEVVDEPVLDAVAAQLARQHEARRAGADDQYLGVSLGRGGHVVVTLVSAGG